MTGDTKIKLYDTHSFRDKFMPAPEIGKLLRGDYGNFFIVHVEDMFRHVAKAVPPSRATNHTMIYLTAGTAYMKIGNDLYTISENEMLIVPAGQIFSFEEYNETKFNQGYLWHFSDKMLAGKIGTGHLHNEFGFLKAWAWPQLRLEKETSLFIGQLLGRLYRAYTNSGHQDLLILQACLIALLCEIKAAWQPVQTERQSASLTLTNKFRELLTSHITTQKKVSGYARLLHVTPNHLNKAVKAVTGRSPGKWIDLTILLEAKVLLSQTGLSVGEIASSIGMEDQSYFSRLFSKYEGVSPLEYRNGLGQAPANR